MNMEVQAILSFRLVKDIKSFVWVKFNKRKLSICLHAMRKVWNWPCTQKDSSFIGFEKKVLWHLNYKLHTIETREKRTFIFYFSMPVFYFWLELSDGICQSWKWKSLFNKLLYLQSEKLGQRLCPLINEDFCTNAKLNASIPRKTEIRVSFSKWNDPRAQVKKMIRKFPFACQTELFKKNLTKYFMWPFSFLFT
jgi:hypothetical protein